MKLYESKTWLAKRYQHDKKTKEEIAAECGVTPKTIYRQLVKFNLLRETRGSRR